MTKNPTFLVTFTFEPSVTILCVQWGSILNNLFFFFLGFLFCFVFIFTSAFPYVLIYCLSAANLATDSSSLKKCRRVLNVQFGDNNEQQCECDQRSSLRYASRNTDASSPTSIIQRFRHPTSAYNWAIISSYPTQHVWRPSKLQSLWRCTFIKEDASSFIISPHAAHSPALRVVLENTIQTHVLHPHYTYTIWSGSTSSTGKRLMDAGRRSPGDPLFFLYQIVYARVSPIFFLVWGWGRTPRCWGAR